MQKGIFVKDMAAPNEAEGVFVITLAAQGSSRNGPYWRLVLADASGSVEAKIWSPLSASFPALHTGSFFYAHGRVSTFRDQLQFTVEEGRLLSPEEGAALDLADFMPASPYPLDAMMDELMALIREEFRYKPWRKLVDGVFKNEELREAFRTCPAAKGVHHAYAGRYAVGAFNVNNMEIVQGIMQAASEEKSPVILQVSSGARSYAGQKYLMKLVEAALAEDPSVPVVVHLDHGSSFELCRDCIDGGFTSVMIDGSHLPYEENIALTKQVVEYAHPRGIWVEAELGKLAGVEEHVSNADHVYTDPDQAVDFVERTGCDSLAVAIGTSHGAYKFKGEAKLDFERLEEIGKRLPGYPLVLHGASSVPQEFVEACNKFGGQVGGARGVPEDMLRKAAGMGVCKINVDTDIRLAVTASIRQYLVEHPEAFDPRAYLKPARQAVKDMVAHKIRNVMGSSGKA